MKTPKILVLGPVSAQASELNSIAKTLAFLTNDYDIDYQDSLTNMSPQSKEEFYQYWQAQLKSNLSTYDVFIGFSFGGVILQQCFTLFESMKKSVILFSTPSFSDESLRLKLSQVIDLCEANQLDKALQALYKNVFLPTDDMDLFQFNIQDKSKACERLSYGLKRVLETDSREILKTAQVDHLHLLGDDSQLVNNQNVVTPRTGTILTVPVSGMRVLQDNPTYCQKAILDHLKSCQLSN